MKETFYRIRQLAWREWQQICTDNIYLFSMVIAPMFCAIFFTTLMGHGLPTKMPIGVVDLDNTKTTRQIVHTLDAFEMVDVVAHYSSFKEARQAMQQGRIYAFYYIPRHTTEDVLSSRRPLISFYTNNSYLIAGSLIYKDMRTLSELANSAVIRANVRGRGASDEDISFIMQPITTDMNILGNPWLHYGVYLNNAFIPGGLMLLIFLVTIYSIGSEIKFGTAHRWMRMAHNDIGAALIGKLLPQTLIFFSVAVCIDIYLYVILHYPCQCGLATMLLASFVMVLASQGFGTFIFSMIPAMRLAMSIGCLWGVVSISICAASFPAMAMEAPVRGLQQLFPLRHYFLIYVNSALNGYPMFYAWQSWLALFLFMILPLLGLNNLKRTLLHYQYVL